MQIGPFELSLKKKAAQPLPVPIAPGTGRGWYPLVVREPFTGAWQQNIEQRPETILAYTPVFTVVTLIAQDIAKCRLCLVERVSGGIWIETTNTAYSPVLRKPNRYQNIIQFAEQWIQSKLIHGNTYVLKQRDLRGVIKGLYILDPRKVRPLLSPDGSIFYEVQADDLIGLTDEGRQAISIPAREIIHDRINALFHPLMGISPLFACGMSAVQGQTIQANSSKFFATGSNPGGVLTAPGAIADETALRLKEYWETNFSGANVGKVAVLGDGLKYEAMSVNAVDAQLIEQLEWTAKMICAAFHVPYILFESSAGAPYANSEPLVQQYYAQCLQSLIANFELCLDEGLEFSTPDLGTEFDIDDLYWMDTATRTKAAADAIGSGAMSPNEARERYFGLGPVPGGDLPFLQQQYYSLEALSNRAAPPLPAAAPPPLLPAADDEDEDGEDDAGDADELNLDAAAASVLKIDWTQVLHHAG